MKADQCRKSGGMTGQPWSPISSKQAIGLSLKGQSSFGVLSNIHYWYSYYSNPEYLGTTAKRACRSSRDIAAVAKSMERELGFATYWFKDFWSTR